MMSRKPSMLFFVLLLLVVTTSWQCEAFTTSQRSSQISSMTLRQSSFSQESPTSTSGNDNVDAMRHDIDAMKREAQKRLEALSHDLEEFQSNKKEPLKAGNQYLDAQGNALSTASLDSMEGGSTAAELTKVTTLMQQAEKVMEQRREQQQQQQYKHEDKHHANKISNTSESLGSVTSVIMHRPSDVHLVENTRWKIVFNLGREPGTWMPATWGASGERLRFTVVVDFLDEDLHEREDFLEGMAGAKKLRVLEAWIGPTFDNSYHGRRNLRVRPTGGYKVVHGAGPLGTDVFRFYIETEESFRASPTSDVSCPRGRVYGNCGYFPTLEPEVRDSIHAYKERLQKDYRAAANQYERLQQEKEEDARLISWDKFSRMNEEVKLRKLMQELDHKIHEARQMEPEKAQLRLSRKGDVGLTKDGGVCCKVQKGLALEYHILGRMEIAAVETEHGDIHEEYEDLVHKLHP
uniref:Uncharacterized protein n=1 Tax=Amphora coffeiformis TaxID=265554 RepID=A0A7S3KZG4_9STRA|mmetsp:Transcript_14005/g.28271  ORF Transcript_14005/g.28271 Transcript_14005/m.28271 type:complete len:463 (+) Transcript_14005:128-1516(+)|eukprot:scaffold1294_cov167-Amphora_coffeaeformis.AAC.14